MSDKLTRVVFHAHTFHFDGPVPKEGTRFVEEAEYERICAEKHDALMSWYGCANEVNDLTMKLAAERQRAEGLRTVLRDLVKWLDDHDWGYVPEPGESCIPFRAALGPRA